MGLKCRCYCQTDVCAVSVLSPCSAFEPDATRYLLMLALVPSSLGLLLSLGMNYVPFVETSEVAHPNPRWSARSRCAVSALVVLLYHSMPNSMPLHCSASAAAADLLMYV